MASSPPENEAEKAPEQPKNITFRFCRECSNMLYPRENPGENTLDFACRTCNFSEPASTSCVFRNELRNTVGETAGITQDVAQDPTLPRINKTCPACSEPEAVFFQSQQRTAETGMKLYYVCVACGNVWQ
ncbi:DNA-directed RNA polymeras-like protein II subunit rpb9 [Tothia fuscella]|uniref:DNA-directed RNA polymerase subunit n=1 Tax=Tothia fuscella TaxID=1048955 RepID=A0A9P4P041_9PEZI|nr:DNA-directed RNA polymeras-like protein II subunit rpb9 [Tothia fuscella]